MSRKKKNNRPFAPIFSQTLYSEEWFKLSNSAKLIYIYIKAGYNTSNNGEITLPYTRIKKIATSKTASKAIKELKENNWIEVTNEKRGLYKEPSKYKLTWTHDNPLK